MTASNISTINSKAAVQIRKGILRVKANLVSIDGIRESKRFFSWDTSTDRPSESGGAFLRLLHDFNKESGPRVAGIVLAKVRDVATARFRRVGSFASWNMDWERKQAILKLFDACDRQIIEIE